MSCRRKGTGHFTGDGLSGLLAERFLLSAGCAWRPAGSWALRPPVQRPPFRVSLPWAGRRAREFFTG